MKRTLLLLTLGAILICPTFVKAQDSTNAPPPGGGPPPGDHHMKMDFLTEAEQQEFHKAHDAALAANPSLATEEKSLMDQMKAAHEAGGPPSEDLKTQMHDFRDKMNAAMIAADANVAPILAKIKAHHHEGHGGPGGPGGPPPAGA